MTVTLLIDTAFETCQIALYRDKSCIASMRETSGGGHDRVLAGMIDRIFSEQKISPKDIERIFVTTGPGRFTGLRVGIAFARGFALVNKTALVPVPCNDAIAYDLAKKNQNAKNLALLIGVKRGQSFVQTIWPEKSDILVIEDDVLATELQNHAPLIIGGVLSPAALGLLPISGVIYDEGVTEPSLEAIFTVGEGVYAVSKAQNPVVRPYYAA